jgi:hypothetical protein
MNRVNTNKDLLISWLPYLVFFIGSFIYFGFFADYIFFYQEKSSLFVFSYDFLVENFHQPGGPLIYLAKFFSTFYYLPIAGALIESVILSLIVLMISRIVGCLTGSNAKVVPFVTGILLFYFQTDYRFLLFNNLGLLFELAIFLLIIKYLPGKKEWIVVLVMPFWYFITGGFSWILVFLLTFYFAFNKVKSGWIRIIALWFISILTVYISEEFLFFQNGKTLWFYPFSELNTGLHSVLFLSISGFISILPAIVRIKFHIPDRIRVSGIKLSISTAATIAIILPMIGVYKYDIKTRQYFHIEKLFYQGKFDEVISYNREYPSSNSLTIFFNNIALCERDLLNDQLFNFHQSPDGNTLFLKWEMVGEVLRRGGYFYYTTGMINEAHRWAFENMVIKGLTPEDLRLLIRTELIYGNYKVASKYIAILKKTVFYNKDAKRFEKLLFNDQAVNADPDLGNKRKIRLNTDFFTITDDPSINIERVFAIDSLNKKAFQYKVAFMLLKKDYQGIANLLPKFEKLGYTKFPQNVEEAAMALSVYNNGKLPDLGNLQINKNTELRWTQYLTVFQEFHTDPKAAEPALRKQFGNTFWYWVFYR